MTAIALAIAGLVASCVLFLTLWCVMARCGQLDDYDEQVNGIRRS